MAGNGADVLRFATVRAGNEQLYGVVTQSGFIALSPEFPQWPSLREVIADQGLPDLAQASAGRVATHSRWEFDIPIPKPEKIICVGVNYPDRNAEYRDGSDAPRFMSLFPRFARSFVGHGSPLVRPPESERLDYEGEVAIVIGKAGRRISRKDAFGHIAALTLCNEGTIRDWVRHAKFNVTQGKNWEGSGSMGPWLVPFEDPSQLEDIRISTRVNGEIRQDDRTGRMLFPIQRQIEYISTFTTLVPGDIIVTGTPTGAGARFEPPVFLQPGDEIEVEAEGIGVLRNGVVDEC